MLFGVMNHSIGSLMDESGFGRCQENITYWVCTNSTISVGGVMGCFRLDLLVPEKGNGDATAYRHILHSCMLPEVWRRHFPVPTWLYSCAQREVHNDVI